MERTDREPKEPHVLNAEFVDVQSKIVRLSEAGGSDNQEKISELKIQRNNLLEDKRVKYKLDQVRRQAIEALNTSDNFDQFDKKLNNLIDDDSSDSMNDIRKEALYQIRLQAHLQVKTDAIKKRFEEDPSVSLTDEYNALQEDREYKKFERVRFFEPADSESEVDFNTPYQEFIQRQKKDNRDDFDVSEELRTDESAPAKPFRPQPLSRKADNRQQRPESDEDDDFERFVLRGEPKDEELTDEEREAELDALLDSDDDDNNPQTRTTRGGGGNHRNQHEPLRPDLDDDWRKRQKQEQRNDNQSPNEKFDNRPLLERVEGLPRHKQLELIRKELTKIEDSGSITTTEYGNANITTQLDNVRKALVREDKPESKEMAAEIEARLSLHECGVMMRRSEGRIEYKRDPEKVGPDNITTIPNALKSIIGKERQLTGEKLRVLLEPGLMRDYEVGYAWDLLQDLNLKRDASGGYVGYGEWIGKVNRMKKAQDGKWVDYPIRPTRWIEGESAYGITDSGFLQDNKEERQDAVRELVIADIAEKIKVSDSRWTELGITTDSEKEDYKKTIAIQSYEMAEKLLWATLETSTINSELNIGDDHLAECIGLRFSRRAARKKNLLPGPLTHIDEIPGFGGSYLRNYLGKEGKNPLYHRDIDYRKLDHDSYKTYGERTIAFNELRKLLLDRSVKKDDLTKDNSEWYGRVNGWILKTDPTDKLKLRKWIIAGIYHVGVNPVGEKDIFSPDAWTAVDIQKLVKRTLTNMDPSNPNSPTFLKEEDWKEINEIVNYSGTQRNLESFFRNLFGKKKS